MEREVKFSLVFRDMWQSAGKYVPRVDQLVKVAPAIIEMGCFARVETNGGGFEQVNLLFGENPNRAVREWTKPFHEAGIQTHMLDRALNGLRMSPVPADVRKLFYKVKHAQGTDITRTFCGLNDVRNIIPSIGYAHEAGMISQCSLCITFSPIHTVEYYVNMAKQLIEAGADEICIKDMAGIGRPVSLGKIVAGIKKIKNIPIQYHSHAGPGFNMASILEVCQAGCDYIDVGMEPLSWGTGHADLISVQAMLKDAGFKVPEINMEAYMKVRSMIQEFMDDFLGLYISPKNRLMNSLLIAPGLPGGMMGSLMADLETNLESINKYKAKRNLPFMTQDELLIKLFNEVAYEGENEQLSDRLGKAILEKEQNGTKAFKAENDKEYYRQQMDNARTTSNRLRTENQELKTETKELKKELGKMKDLFNSEQLEALRHHFPNISKAMEEGKDLLKQITRSRGFGMGM